jgi:hypothetical protein
LFTVLSGIVLFVSTVRIRKKAMVVATGMEQG